MSTEVLSKSYNRILLYMHILKKVVGLLQQASFDSWLSYPTIDTTCKAFVAHESTNHQHNTPPDSLSSTYERANRGTHTYLEAFSSIHLLVHELHRRPSSPLPRTQLFE